jgi:DedD protein
MEEALKARLIGAAVLVAIAVLLIPELLSGRKAVEPVAEQGTGQRGTRTFTIELDGAPGQSARSPMTSAPPAAETQAPAAIVPQADTPRPGPEPAAEPVPQPGPQVAEAQRPPAQPAAATTAPATSEQTVESPPVGEAPAARPAVAAPAAGGDWAVQVGAFGSADTARKLVKDLTGAGYRAFVSPVLRGGKTLHRVRVGPEADKASAEQVAQRLKGRGLPATVVRNE